MSDIDDKSTVKECVSVLVNRALKQIDAGEASLLLDKVEAALGAKRPMALTTRETWIVAVCIGIACGLIHETAKAVK